MVKAEAWAMCFKLLDGDNGYGNVFCKKNVTVNGYRLDNTTEKEYCVIIDII